MFSYNGQTGKLEERTMSEWIRIRGARQNNLRNIDLDIPKKHLVVITGVSGSGKSSLAYDTIFAEAQRQLLETFSTYARQRLPRYERPDVDSLGGLAPAIVIDQKRVGQTSRSTVGTFTEAWTLLRLLFARCGEPRAVGDSNVFSFNRPEGMCPVCKGVGHQVEVDVDRVVAWDRTVREGGIRHPDFKVGGAYYKRLLAAGLFSLDTPIGELPEEALERLLYSEKRRLKNHDATRYFNITFEGVIRTIERRWLHKEEDDSEYAKRRHEFFRRGPCPECNGTRLNLRARSVRIAGLTIAEMGDLEVRELRPVLEGVTGRLADPIIPRILQRLDALVRVGAGYLSLNRATATLSGGESQRLKMARQLGCELEGLIYVLDEPTVGLHPHDIGALLEMLRTIRDKGNTVLVVEHDPAVIQAADHCIDLGPGAGEEGGNLVFSGPVSGLAAAETPTAGWLQQRHGTPPPPRRPIRGTFPIRRATLHNLRNLSVDIPLERFVCITGVAGSGKSTLVTDLFVKQHPSAVVVDQSPVARSQRSNPATYTGAFTPIRELFAKGRDVEPGHFSFNSSGACPECKGMGVLEVEMRFLDAVRMTCPKCKGLRYDNTVLHFKLRGRTIADVLAMTVADALRFFADQDRRREVADALEPLVEVGLGYLRLGQPLSTVSGGEAQRLKLARELARGGCTYVLDEPTTGLHMADVDSLVGVFHRLVERRNSVLVIEHNLDVIRQADWVIDLGPGAGKEGGCVVAQGTPEQVAAHPDSVTGRYLRAVLPG
jgi:excinuclease UvrABC ATPase subunit